MRRNMLAGAIAASALSLGAVGAVGAQSVQGGSSGGIQGRDVSAGTYGTGQYTRTPDGSNIGVGGGGTAEALNGGTAETRSDAKLNERRAMQRSVATARDEDERARSRTRTVVKEDEVRSRTMTRYKQRGEKPVRTMESTVTTPDGTQIRTK